SHVAWGETAKDAVTVFDKSVAAHGVPQRLLSDNGLALNPSRRGVVGQLVAHVGDLGVEAITGKPYKPTTQGKNERFHQTLFRYLDKQPLAESLAELQAQVDAFDDIYNTQRPHQGLPGRLTPLAAWEATSKADPPRPKPDRPLYQAPVPSLRPRPKPPADLPADTRIRTVNTSGTIRLDKVLYKVDVDHAFEQVLVVNGCDEPGDKIIITDMAGEILAEHTRPAPGVTYVGNGRRPGPRPKNPKVSPKS
ncbi:MAG TPA: integrase core domain-containing protein, partial [Nocardioidaceae bacterium]|nr:integrase core domain-containing protein [Nocardioidaceae bacterium]